MTTLNLKDISSRSCPLALLAQTCCKIKPNLLSLPESQTTVSCASNSILQSTGQFSFDQVPSLSGPNLVVKSLPKVGKRLAPQHEASLISSKLAANRKILPKIQNCEISRNSPVLQLPICKIVSAQQHSVNSITTKRKRPAVAKPSLNATLPSCETVIQFENGQKGVLIDSSSVKHRKLFPNLAIQTQNTLLSDKTQVTLLGPFSQLIKTSENTTGIQTLKKESLAKNNPISSGSVNGIGKICNSNNFITSCTSPPNVGEKQNDVQFSITPESVLVPSNFQNTSSEYSTNLIDVMQPETLTAQMLKVVPPQKHVIPVLKQVNVPEAVVSVEVSDTRQQVPRNGTVQITIPPNTSPDGLQQILLLAARAAQKYQNIGKTGTVVIRGEVNSVNSELLNVQAGVTKTTARNTNPVLPNKLGGFSEATMRKVRTPCRCLNCVKLNSTKGKMSSTKKRVHICCYANCGKEFSKTSHLRAHIRSHTGERPYACDFTFCNRKFARSDELLRHRRTHGGVKRFICKVCSKGFMRSDHLTKHLKTHK